MRLTRRVIQAVTSLSPRGKAAIVLIVDSCAVVVAFAVAAFVQMPAPAAISGLLGAIPALLVLVAISAAASLTIGIPLTRLRDCFDVASTRQTALLALVVAGTSAILLHGRFGAGVHIVYAMALFLVMTLSRAVMYEVLVTFYRRAALFTRVLIYGAGATGAQLAKILRHHDGIEAVAFIDDNPALHSRRVAGLRVHPPLRIAGLAAERGVSRVILAMPSLAPHKQQLIARRLFELGLEVQAPPSFSQLLGTGLAVDRLENLEPNRFLDRTHLDCDTTTLHGAYRGKSVLVSGAGGSIGSELCRQIISLGPRRIVLLELTEYALFQIERELRAAFEGTDCEIVPVLGSVTDPRLVRHVLKRHEVGIVLHAAAYKHVPLVEANALAGLANNVLGTNTLAREAEAAGVERFILISSDKAVEPSSVMGATKRLAELVVQDLARRADRTRFAAVRFGNVLGSSGSVIPVFREQIARGGPVTVTHQDATRFFMTVEEAVHLVLIAGAHAKGGEVFALDMGEPVRIVDLARKLITASGYSMRDAANPQGEIEIAFTGLRPGEKVHEARMTERATGSGVHPAIFLTEPARVSEFELATMLKSIRDAVATGDWEVMPPALARLMAAAPSEDAAPTVSRP